MYRRFAELAEALKGIPHVVQLHLEVETSYSAGMKFNYKIKDGESKVHGYGITVATMAGFPHQVIDCARRTAEEVHNTCIKAT